MSLSLLTTLKLLQLTILLDKPLQLEPLTSDGTTTETLRQPTRMFDWSSLLSKTPVQFILKPINFFVVMPVLFLRTILAESLDIRFPLSLSQYKLPVQSPSQQQETSSL
jgi:hypothetical protein